MPFDYKKYDEKCAALTPEELQREWNHYTRALSSVSTSTAISGAALGVTLGVSAVGIAMSAPAIYNARRKRAITEAHNTTHATHRSDVLKSAAVSSAIGLFTLGAGYAGSEAIISHGVAAVAEKPRRDRGPHGCWPRGRREGGRARPREPPEAQGRCPGGRFRPRRPAGGEELGCGGHRRLFSAAAPGPDRFLPPTDDDDDGLRIRLSSPIYYGASPQPGYQLPLTAFVSSPVPTPSPAQPWLDQTCVMGPSSPYQAFA